MIRGGALKRPYELLHPPCLNQRTLRARLKYLPPDLLGRLLRPAAYKLEELAEESRFLQLSRGFVDDEGPLLRRLELYVVQDPCDFILFQKPPLEVPQQAQAHAVEVGPAALEEGV